MQRMPEFRLARPATYAEAAALLAAEPGSLLLGGGTDLLPNLRRGLGSPSWLIDLGAVQGRSELEFGNDQLVLGAGLTLARLAADDRIDKAYAAIGEAARAAAGPAHRSAATLGGNLCLDTRCIFYNQSDWWRTANGYCLKRGGETCHVAPQGQRCHAAFSGDLAPALIALDADVELLSCRGTRRLALVDCYADDGAAPLAFGRDEVMVRVRVPAPPARTASGYRKARVRGAIDFALAGVACALSMGDGIVAGMRLALTGTNPRPLLLEGTQALVGQPLDDAALAQLGKLVQKQVSPMRTTSTASNHRRRVAAVHAQRLVRALAEEAAR
jgi:4-hydroxybenzoyl-CoA reductase subunit beta